MTGFQRALFNFASETEPNKAAVLALRASAMAALLASPDGNLLTQVAGTLNGKTFNFSVDRKLSDLLVDLDIIKGLLDSDSLGGDVRGVTFDFQNIQH